MKKIVSIMIVFALSVVLFAACDTTHSNLNSNTSAKMTNSELETAVENKLNADAQLKAADLDVDADASANQVTLSGTVMSQELKMKAVNAAKSAHAGVAVNDKIAVKSAKDMTREDYTEDMARDQRNRARDTGDNIGDTLDDAWIHTKITAKLFGNADTPGRKINVDVNNNTVTLRGTVDTTEQKSEAERVAKDTDGVKKVVNQLKVGKS